MFKFNKQSADSRNNTEGKKTSKKSCKPYPGLSTSIFYSGGLMMLPLRLGISQIIPAEVQESFVAVDRIFAGTGMAVEVANILTSLGAPPAVGICLGIADKLLTTAKQTRDNQSRYVNLAHETRNKIIELIPKLSKFRTSEARL
ncbi:hypothetical protein AX16_008557 [Volvariella volvacea WC 439]|nr:hypothetical protein AX16_008557 [Volvariella volvacea WC 439]